MTLPTFEDIMLPLVDFLGDAREKNYSEVIDYLINYFELQQEDVEKEKLSGGNYLYNRIGWAKDYLTRADILEKHRGKFKITSRGLDILKHKPSKINRKFLLQFKELDDAELESDEAQSELFDSGKSPDDLIDAGIFQINAILIQDLLKKLKSTDSTFFERLVLDLVEKLGYGKGKHVGKSGDKGIDGEIPQDKLGLDMIYLQAKRHSSNVPIKDVRDFIGSLSIKKARKGILITTSDFSSEAYKDVTASEKSIVLINGKRLVKYMIENNVGIKVKNAINIKEIDEEYFE